MSVQKLYTEKEGSLRVWENRNKNVTLDKEQVKERKEMEKYYEKKSEYRNLSEASQYSQEPSRPTSP